LINDDLGVAVGYGRLNPQGDNNAQPMNQSFILDTVVALDAL
jgi:hypothetical protein